MILYGHNDLVNLLKDKYNNICFDCLSNKVDWASINNAVFLCTNCAGEHRSYGVNISFIKSLTLDIWKDNQAKNMSLGGNSRLASLLNIYNIDITKVNKNQLYNSRLVDFYRKLLKVEGLSLKHDMVLPSKEEALKPLLVNHMDNYGKTFGSKFKINTLKKKVSFENNSSNDNKSLVSDKLNDNSCNNITIKSEEKGFIGDLNKWLGGNYMVDKIFSVPTVVTKTIFNETTKLVSNTTDTIFDKSVDCVKNECINKIAKSANDGINKLFNKIYKNKLDCKEKLIDCNSDNSNSIKLKDIKITDNIENKSNNKLLDRNVNNALLTTNEKSKNSNFRESHTKTNSTNKSSSKNFT